MFVTIITTFCTSLEYTTNQTNGLGKKDIVLEYNKEEKDKLTPWVQKSAGISQDGT